MKKLHIAGVAALLLFAAMKKVHIAGVAALLLFAPFVSAHIVLPSAARAAASEGIVLHDTVKEFVRPAQEVREGAEIDRERSVACPFPTLIVEDQCTEVYDESGRKVFYSSYPMLHFEGDTQTPLAQALAAWSAEMAEGFAKSPVRRESELVRRKGHDLFLCYSDIARIAQWGRVDDQMLSFFLQGSVYRGGPHPIPLAGAVNLDAVTGQEIALDEIVTSREDLLAALAVAFREQYPGREDETFAHDIEEQLAQIHTPDKGLNGFCWYMDADGSLVVHYNNYALAPYASGSFTLTVTREAAPELFTAAYPME